MSKDDRLKKLHAALTEHVANEYGDLNDPDSYERELLDSMKTHAGDEGHHHTHDFVGHGYNTYHNEDPEPDDSMYDMDYGVRVGKKGHMLTHRGDDDMHIVHHFEWKPRPVEEVVPLLNHKEPQVRERAIEHILDHGDPELKASVITRHPDIKHTHLKSDDDEHEVVRDAKHRRSTQFTEHPHYKAALHHMAHARRQDSQTVRFDGPSWPNPATPKALEHYHSHPVVVENVARNAAANRHMVLASRHAKMANTAVPPPPPPHPASLPPTFIPHELDDKLPDE